MVRPTMIPPISPGPAAAAAIRRSSPLSRRHRRPYDRGPHGRVALRGRKVQSSAASGVLRIGTRGSPLALKQAQLVREALTPHGLAASAIELIPIRTSGDKIQDRPLAEAGGKGLFAKEIEQALLEGAIDLAGHSA